MPNNTTNYNLIKPLGTENYNINNDNTNMDSIDAQLKVNANGIATNASNITTNTTAITTKAPLASPTFTGIATLPTNSVSDSLLISLNATVTATGTTQATATALTKDENVITTGNGGVVVQGATTGKIVVIINKTASAINIYPAVGHYFDGLAVNIPISLPVNAFIELYGFSSTQWNSTINAVTNATNTIIADVGGNFTSTIKNAETITTEIANKLANLNGISMPYVVTTGSANTYIDTLNPAPTAYIDGMGIVVKINVASTGASTINVNSLGAKSIKDSLGNAITSGGLKANTPYTLRYESVSGSFILQGKGGGGNLIASQLLSGITATGDTGAIVGTMPNNGDVSRTPTTSAQTIPLGYTTGGTISAVVVPVANVLVGTTIAGATGTMVNNTGIAKVYTVSTADQAVMAGFTDGAVGSIKVKGEAALLSSNILPTATIGGITGTASNIKSIQRGNMTLSANSSTVTIASVDLTKAIVRMSYSMSSGGTSGIANDCATVALTNATTLTFSVGTYYDNVNINWEVIEFNNVKTLQSGQKSTALASDSITIASINPLKAMLFYTFSGIQTGGTMPPIFTNAYIYNATTIITSQYTTYTKVINWQVVEFN